MEFISAKLEGVFKILLNPMEDHRGSLVRTWCKKEFESAGLSVHWVQCNHTVTRQRGALRGMHFQAEPNPEQKLIRCLRGRVFDVVVDIRRDSETFGQWEAFELSEDQPDQLLVPSGFAHGFQCLTEDCQLYYQMSEYYRPELARGIRWDDPDAAISWPLEVTDLSERDQSLPLLRDLK